MTKDFVTERLGFAEKRLKEFFALNGGDLAGANPSERQQLLQEFFFHLVSTIEVLAQLVNEIRKLIRDPEDVSVRKISDMLPRTDPLKAKLAALYATTKGKDLPANPYSDDGYIFRIYNYRHQVIYRGTNPFLFRIPGRSASPLLDPRDSGRGASPKAVQDEMHYMLQLVGEHSKEVLALL